MNPILLKPSSDIGSQVIVGGEVRGQMSAAEYFRGKAPAGAGGPLRLREPGGGERCHRHRGGGQPGGDQPPGGRHREHGPGGAGGRPGAPGRGHRPGRGVRPAVRHRGIAAAPGAPAGEKGLLINKFRGDEAILRPGLAMLEELTDIPVLGVVPYLRVDIDDEDSWPPGWKPGGAQALDIAVIRLPRISNFTDFSLLEEHPALGVRYVQSCRELGRPRPGGPAGDQEHPGRPPLAAAERPGGRHPEAGLGRHPGAGGVRRLPDAGPQPGRPLGHRGGAESSAAWGCCRWTRCSAPKRPAPGVRGQVTAPGLAGAQLDGYEIHTGRTTVEGEPFCLLGKRPARRLCPRECVRHLPPRPVRHRQPHPKAGGIPLRKKGDHRGAVGARLPTGSTRSASWTCWPRACARPWTWTRSTLFWKGGGEMRGLIHLYWGDGKGQDHRRHGPGPAGPGCGQAGGRRAVPQGPPQRGGPPAHRAGGEDLPGARPGKSSCSR